MNATKEQLERFAKSVLQMFDGTEYGERVEDCYYRAVHGDHFTEDSLETAVDGMHNEDGSYGPHWSVSQTTPVARSAGISFDTFNEYDWNYAMNMMYSDYSSVLGNQVDAYARMARAFLTDKDGPEGKAYIYWKSMRH